MGRISAAGKTIKAVPLWTRLFRRRGITFRWFMNSVGLSCFLIVTVSVILIMSIYRWLYSGVQQTVSARTEILTSLFISNNQSETTEMTKAAREFIENFEDKEKMELMIFDKYGNLLVSSTGFEPDVSQSMPDYAVAVGNSDVMGIWTGRLNTGEKAMACTMTFAVSENISGAIRVIVSMRTVDSQVWVWSALICMAGAIIIFFVILSGLYFVRSILNPVKQINLTARRVAKGDFDARLEKKYNDEIGELCDTINYMASELGATERMKNDFISSVSHELRTPLTAIKGWAETIQDSGQNNREMTARGLEVIAKESERLSGLVEELLDFSKIQNGRLQMQMAKMDLLADLGEAVYMLQEHARRKNIEIQYEEPDIPAPVYGDEKRLLQVFLNVIENAVKYSEDGSAIAVRAWRDGDRLKTTVQDHGCGIAPADLPKVKEKFFKANMTRGGSGIGLALADEIVRMHGGSLDIESKLNEGTTVTISLPVCR